MCLINKMLTSCYYGLILVNKVTVSNYTTPCLINRGCDGLLCGAAEEKVAV